MKCDLGEIPVLLTEIGNPNFRYERSARIVACARDHSANSIILFLVQKIDRGFHCAVQAIP